MFQRMRLPKWTALLAALAIAPAARGGDINNVTLSGSTLDVITADRAGMVIDYDALDLINVTLTDIDGQVTDSDRARLFVADGDPVPADRSSVIEDLDLATGINNPESITVDFNSPIVNSAGSDLILFDWGTDDPISITINGVTHNYGSAAYDNEPGGSLITDIYRSSTSVNSVSDLESDSYSQVGGSESGQTALGIDLSDFGLALNQSAVTVRIDDNTAAASSMDPLAVVGMSKVGGLVDDFEQDYGGTNNIDGGSGWTANGGVSQVTVFDPTFATPNSFVDNRVLLAAEDAQNIFHAAQISDGLTGFLQFDVYNPDADTSGDPDSNTPDLNIGLTTQATPDEAADMAAMVRVVGTNLQVYDGGFKTVLTSSFAEDTWYTIRIAVDNLNDIYQVYIKGGTFADFTLLNASGDDTFAFRSGAGANDLVNFYVRTNGGHDGDIAYLDNVFVLIPTPAALPGGLMLITLLAGRRRRG
ncbi:hypothetical protein HED60_16615 [Planctomycetales bacterium ZRK34]|nr:hypothetical protein HED60_16615 [Planctomycetales bacterium ZRK34]